MLVESFRKFIRISLPLASGLILSACATHTAKLPPSVEEINPDKPGWYPQFEDKVQYPDFVELFPAPPAENSPIFANDKKVFKDTRKLKGTQVWYDAAKFARIAPEVLSEYFSPVMSRKITKEETPWTYYIIARIIADVAGSGTRDIKHHYKRVRPFVYFNTGTCSTKEDEEAHRKSYSYPSSHAAYGQALALILTEIDPANQAKIAKKGIEYGQFRVICGFHWDSDVNLGRLVASHVVARLHTNMEFIEALKNAKAEFGHQTR